MTAKIYPFPPAEAKELIQHFSPMSVSDTVKSIVSALSNHYGSAEAIAIAGSWSSVSKVEIVRWAEHSDSRATINHVIYLAQKLGYTLPYYLQEFIKHRQKRKAGPVALEDVFAGGIGLASIGQGLYQYSLTEGYYQSITNNAAKKLIAEYFSIYETKPDEHGFATNRQCNDALAFIKTRTYVDPATVNPPGINLASGYLRLTYDSHGNPHPELLPHSPHYVFTYRSPVTYDPDANSNYLDKVISDMLPCREHQEILFRVLGASLDLSAIRKRRGRDVRALFLLGEGNNGKDTLRECLCQVYGGHGVTAIPLQAFKAADKQQSFGLYDLVVSRVNWSSENDKVSIDTCQTLKNVITGEEVTVEKKYEQGFTTRPKAVVIFNLNDSPAIESQQEAITSRYALLPFNTVFKSNPDPAHSHEKQADPRLKDDPEYLRETILPAFLNRMLQGYEDALAQGIDYSSIGTLMNEIRESNSHIISFIKQTNLVECTYSEGLKTSDIYASYERWCYQRRVYRGRSLSQNLHRPQSLRHSC